MSKKASSKKQRIIPLGDRVLLQEMKETENATKSGILLPEAAGDKDTKKGVVVAVGKGRYDDGKLVPMSVKEGDIVIYSWGDKIKIDGQEYMLVREGEISAVIN